MTEGTRCSHRNEGLPLHSPLWKKGALVRISGQASSGRLNLLALGYCLVHKDSSVKAGGNGSGGGEESEEATDLQMALFFK